MWEPFYADFDFFSDTASLRSLTSNFGPKRVSSLFQETIPSYDMIHEITASVPKFGAQSEATSIGQQVHRGPSEAEGNTVAELKDQMDTLYELLEKETELREKLEAMCDSMMADLGRVERNQKKLENKLRDSERQRVSLQSNLDEERQRVLWLENKLRPVQEVQYIEGFVGGFGFAAGVKWHH